jgi:hypothetical protein
MVRSFEVVVRGRMSADIADALEGFAVEAQPGGVTSIVGPVVDQPRLLALLSAFDDLHIEVISVNPVDEGVHDGRAGKPPESPERGDADGLSAH